MNINLLHDKCKLSTRKAFEEYKRQVNLDLFPYDKDFHTDLKYWVFMDVGKDTTKYFVNNYDLSIEQLRYLNKTIEEYKAIFSKTVDNYFKKCV